MVAQLAAIPIATTIGEFAAPYLIRKAGEIGVKKFIQTYGNTAWQSIAGVTGGMIAQLTEPVDLQTEKLFGMPVSRITGQGEVYDDIDYSYVDEDKENDEVPTKTTEEKLTDPTEPEPPKDPDVGADLAAEAAIHTTKKLLEDKELSISQQTKNLTSKIKNKITTWELLADTKEEFKKLAEENKISVEELEKGAIQKQIKFKKFGKHFDVYFNNKKIAELANITQEVREDESSWRPKNINTYNLVYLTEEGYFDNGVDTIDGIENAKNSTMQYISNDLMDETKSDKYALGFTSLREIFQEMEYNKKGEPISVYEREKKK